MKGISLLLEKYKTIGIKEDELVDTVCEVINNLFGDDTIDRSKVSMSDGVVHMDVSGALRSELFLHKEKILTALRNETTLRIDDMR